MAAYIVLSSATAYVSPTVEVHAIGCEHVDRRLSDEEWDAERADDINAARRTASVASRRVRMGDAPVAWMDCALALTAGASS